MIETARSEACIVEGSGSFRIEGLGCGVWGCWAARRARSARRDRTRSVANSKIFSHRSGGSLADEFEFSVPL